MTDPFDLARFVTAVNLRRLVAAAVIVIPSNGPVRMSSSIRTTVNNPELRAEALGFGLLHGSVKCDLSVCQRRRDLDQQGFDQRCQLFLL